MPEYSKLNSGENITESADPDALPRKAKVVRKRGQQPEVIVAPVVPLRVARKEDSCCPRGHTVEGGMKFCPECGSELVAAARVGCAKGHKNPSDAKFCATCGVILASESSTTPLTEEQRKSKEQAHAQALALGRENPVAAYAPGRAPSAVEVVLIHFLMDGFSAFGKVWMRGQEIEVWPGHPRWPEAQRWITLDTAGQYARFGKQVFGNGPWPGARSYTAGVGRFQQLKNLGGDGTVSGPTAEELAKADEAEKRRGRRVPNLIG